MSDARQIRLVAARELRERGRSRAFVASFVLMLLAVAGAIALPELFETGQQSSDVGLVGAAPPELTGALQAQGDSVDTTIRVQRFDTRADGEAALRAGDVDVLVVDARQLEWRRRVDERLRALVTGAIQIAAIRERADAAGIEADRLLAVVEPVEVTNLELGRTEGRTAEDETAAFLMTLVLFFSISTYGAMVLSGVVEEKSSRTVEVLLARMPARNLLAGKIAGIGLLGLAQIVATAAVALGVASLVDSVDIPAVRGAVLAWAVVWFVLGYALYATVYGTLGSLATRTEDASSVTGPVSIVLVVGFLVSFATIGSIEATWARLVAWFPLTAPLAMPNRIAMGAATWWDPVISMLLTLATIALLVALGGRIYTRAILHTGATLSLGTAWRDTRLTTATGGSWELERKRHEGGDEEREEAPSMTSTSSREAGIQLILMIAAVAIGGVAFGLSGDFVLGVGVGAVVFVLVRQVTRMWTRGGTDDTAAAPPRGEPAER